MNGFQREPTAIVNTGDRYNAYWRLKKPATTDQKEEIESHLKRIASHLGGDKKVTTVDCFLRIPYTWNSECGKPVTIEDIIRLEKEYNLKHFGFLRRS